MLPGYGGGIGLQQLGVEGLGTRDFSPLSRGYDAHACGQVAQVAPLALTSLPAAAPFLPHRSDPSGNISGAGW